MIRTVQAGSGVFVFVFLAVHLANTYLAALGAQPYNAVQSTVRMVYQWWPVEITLLAAIVVHAAAGLWRIFKEPARLLTLRSRLHRYAGFFLLLVIVGHVIAVRGVSFWFGVHPEFVGLAFSMQYLPQVFYPYYFLLAVAGFYHGLNGFSIAAGRLGMRLPLRAGTLAWAGAAAVVLTVFALLGMGGVLFDVGSPEDSPIARLALQVWGVEP